MIKVREQNEEENLMHGDNFPITLIIGDTTKYLTKKAFNELRNELNKFAIPNVERQSEQLVCPNCDGEGFSGKGTTEVLPCLSCFGSGERVD